MASAAIELRAAIIAALKADAGVKATAMGASPRVYNRAPPANTFDARAAFPFIVIATPARPWDTTTERGAEIDVELRLMGEFEGDEEGEAIFEAILRALRDWAPQSLSSHGLANLVCQFSNVRSDEDGKRYIGLQRWRAVTEETN